MVMLSCRLPDGSLSRAERMPPTRRELRAKGVRAVAVMVVGVTGAVTGAAGTAAAAREAVATAAVARASFPRNVLLFRISTLAARL